MNTFDQGRRRLFQTLGAAASLTLLPGAARVALAADGKAKGRVVVIGGGFGGATAAKYLRKLSGGALQVTLIERNKEFISCPGSNEVLSGVRTFDSLRHSYDGLRERWGVEMVHASVVAVDTAKRRVRTDTAGEFEYDRLVLSPGFDFSYDQIAGLDETARDTILHAWKAGPQTVALRQQLESMPDGGVYALTIPKAPYRCPPGPYERACQIAFYFKQHKPKSKVLLLDANDKVQSKEKLFTAVWAKDYQGLIEYRPGWNAVAVESASKTVTSEMGDKVQADVLNILPPMRAGEIAHAAGVV
ncbi:MAG: NAD(P)/FAD-dependent oxidoreductase, partial [Rhodospirillales bacterium]|nr:NAD(P)/FAD-dependent oxidoreductase [Rhodospirillales bacterium]